MAIAAPARKVTESEIEPAVRLLQSWGLEVEIPDGLYSVENQFAGDDAHRAGLMQSLLDDTSIRAIFCARGGYGTVRIVDRLDFSRFCESPKWIVGYSDITVLHSHIARNCAVPTMHATMPIDIPADESQWPSPSVESLRWALFEGHGHYEFANSSDAANRAGCCCGEVVGGNLSILYSLLASPSDVDTDGKILLIEDLDEYLYHIDRMMMALKRAGKLQGLRGLLVGAMSNMHDNAVPFGRTAEEIVRDAVADYGYPVAFNCLFGHIGTENRALPLGVETKVRVASDSVAIDVGI